MRRSRSCLVRPRTHRRPRTRHRHLPLHNRPLRPEGGVYHPPLIHHFADSKGGGLAAMIVSSWASSWQSRCFFLNKTMAEGSFSKKILVFMSLFVFKKYSPIYIYTYIYYIYSYTYIYYIYQCWQRCTICIYICIFVHIFIHVVEWSNGGGAGTGCPRARNAAHPRLCTNSEHPSSWANLRKNPRETGPTHERKRRRQRSGAVGLRHQVPGQCPRWRLLPAP